VLRFVATSFAPFMAGPAHHDAVGLASPMLCCQAGGDTAGGDRVCYRPASWEREARPLRAHLAALAAAPCCARRKPSAAFHGMRRNAAGSGSRPALSRPHRPLHAAVGSCRCRRHARSLRSGADLTRDTDRCLLQPSSAFVGVGPHTRKAKRPCWPRPTGHLSSLSQVGRTLLSSVRHVSAWHAHT
jgi:hypothetical protein